MFRRRHMHSSECCHYVFQQETNQLTYFSWLCDYWMFHNLNHSAFSTFLLVFLHFSGQTFPATIESTVRKIHRYLFHVLAHVYHAHYCDIVSVQLHGHLNTLFTHFMVFNIKFDLMEEKEMEILQDLLKALMKQLPDPNQNDGKENQIPHMGDNSLALTHS